MANKNNRSKIPKDIEAKVIFKSDRTCCVCHEPRRKWQINHINHNNKDHREENLCILCLECHDAFHSKSAISKGLTEGAVRFYKKHWEYTVRKKREKESGFIYKKINLSKEQFIFEIEKTGIEIITLKQSDPRIKEKVQYLWEINLYKGYTGEILDVLHNIALQSFGEFKKEVLVAEDLKNYFLHLVGPDEVSWNNRNKVELGKSVEILTIIGNFIGEYSRKKQYILILCNNFLEFFNIFILYKKQELGCMILESLLAIKNVCLEKDENGKVFKDGMKIIKKTTEDMVKIVNKERFRWKKFDRISRKLID